MPLIFEKATAARLMTLSREQTVFFFPVGPLEDHGPHLPVGLDLFEAERLATLAAERLEAEQPGWIGVVMPRAPLGVNSDTGVLALTVRGHVLRDWLVDACHSLHRAGFRHFVCFSGHLGPRQLTAIEEAGKFLRRRAGGAWPLRYFKRWTQLPVLVSASSALIPPELVSASPFWPDPAEHGGKRDSSVALAVVPELVDELQKTLPAEARAESRWERTRRRFARKLQGYWGKPADATPEAGAAALKETLDEVMPKLRAVWGGSNPELLFRSWYSILPPNQTFFLVWVMGVFAFALMVASLFMMIHAMEISPVR